jgi:malate synthase
MKTPNQIFVKRDDVHITAKDLVEVPAGEISEAGLRLNINVGLQYLESWLRGNGCVPIYNLMEDAATAEISRAQVWQWVRHKAKLSDGRTITKELVDQTLREELEKLKAMLGAERFQQGKFELAAELYEKMMTTPQFDEFLTLKAYEYV